MQYIEDGIENGDDADNVDHYGVTTDQTIQVSDDADQTMTDTPVKYVVSYENMAAHHEEHVAVSEDGTSYYAMSLGAYMTDSDRTSEMQQKISDLAN